MKNGTNTRSPGQWIRTSHDSPEWNGRCQRCDSVVPAIELRLRIGSFGKPDLWVCASGCEALPPAGNDAALLKELRKMLRGKQ